MSELNTSADAPLRLSIEDGLATLTFNQPKRGNPIDGAFCREFREAALTLWNTAGLRAVLIRAEGPNFSFGGDIKMFYPQRDQLSGPIRTWTADLHTGLVRFWQLPVPVIAEVQGFAMGGSVGVLAGADVVVAGASTKFGSAFAHIGFSCDSGSTVTLTHRMGASRAKRFMLLGEVLTSEQALNAGLADIVVADADLPEQAQALTRRLASGPTTALGEMKRLFLRAGEKTLETQLEDEALTLARVAGTADAQEGIAAMAERRPAKFSGC